MKKTLIFFGLLLFFSFKHPFYLSVSDLKYKSEEKVLQASIKIFLNDLEDALFRIHHRSVDLINIKDSLGTKQVLNEYIKKRLIVRWNKKVSNYEFLGFEKEQEAIWIYLEYKGMDAPQHVFIENSILYDFIKTQSNIVHLQYDGNKKSGKVNYPEKNLSFDF